MWWETSVVQSRHARFQLAGEWLEVGGGQVVDLSHMRALDGDGHAKDADRGSGQAVEGRLEPGRERAEMQVDPGALAYVVAAGGGGRHTAAVGGEEVAERMRRQSRFEQVVGYALRRAADVVADNRPAVGVGDRGELRLSAGGLVEAVVECLDEGSQPGTADALLRHHVPAIVFGSAFRPVG